MADVGFRLALGAATLLAAAGCSVTNPIMGLDASTQTYASQITWSDGKPAYLIRCPAPEPCLARIVVICSSGSYTMLESQNIPAVATRRGVQEPPLIVARCG
jgi:hypothetical protein